MWNALSKIGKSAVVSEGEVILAVQWNEDLYKWESSSLMGENSWEYENRFRPGAKLAGLVPIAAMQAKTAQG